jgi:DNA-binding Xre family transcriptional regulator
MKINLRYLPKRLSRKDKTRQSKMLMKSRRLYKKGKYFTRRKVSSFKSKKSPHIIKAMKIYNVDKIAAKSELAKATGCSKSALAKIINKGAGAYYSSGSRPNQTAQSWGLARLASSITAGKAAAVDYNILEKGCKSNSKALTMAKKAKRKYGHGTRKVPKVKI